MDIESADDHQTFQMFVIILKRQNKKTTDNITNAFSHLQNQIFKQQVLFLC